VGSKTSEGANSGNSEKEEENHGKGGGEGLQNELLRGQETSSQQKNKLEKKEQEKRVTRPEVRKVANLSNEGGGKNLEVLRIRLSEPRRKFGIKTRLPAKR